MKILKIIVAALLLVACGNSGSDARFPRGGGASSAFNSGKTQVNLSHLSYPFINVIKAATEDIKEAGGSLNGAPADPSTRDSDGWPMSTSNGWLVRVDMPSSADRPGNWIQTWDGLGTIQNLITAVAYTITSATNAASAVLTINLASPVSPNTVTTSQLKLGQCIQLNSVSGGTWGTVSGNFYKITDVAVGGDPTKVQIDLNSTGLGTLSSGQVKNALRNTTTASAACIGRYVFTPPSNGTFQISQTPGVASMSAAPDYIKNMALFHGDDETVFLAGQVWSPKTVAKLQDLKAGMIRMIDLQKNNGEKTVDWATRKPTTYAVWLSSTWRPGSISPSGISTASTDGKTYTVTWAAYSLLNDAIVHVFFNRSQYKGATAAVSSGANTVITVAADSSVNPVFTNGDAVSVGLVEGPWSVMNGNNYTVQSATSTSVTINYDSSALTPGAFAGGRPIIGHKVATLNVGGTGAKTVLQQNTTLSDAGTDRMIVGNTTNSYATVLYKSTLNAWIKTGGDLGGSSGYTTYAPPELYVSLCTAVGAHPWVNAPAYDDTASWVTGFATYVRDSGPSWMKAVNETVNELFNSASGFENNGYAVAQELYINGGWNQSTGRPSGTGYSVTALTTGATTTITFNVAFTGQVGAFMQLGGTFSGTSGLSNGQYVHVTAINVGGNPNRVTVDATSSGTWTSGGTAAPAPGEVFEWQGTHAARMAKAVSDVFSGNTARYYTSLGVQLAKGTSPSDANAAISSPQFVLQGGWPAYTYLTSVDTSNYIQSSEYGTGTETTRVSTWAPRQGTGTITGTTLVMSGGTNPNVGDELAGFGIRIGTTVLSGSAGTYTVSLTHTPAYSGNVFAGVAATMRAQETAYLNASVTGSGQENLNIAATYWLAIANWANGWGVKNMLGYEGGPDAFANGTSSALDQFRFYTLQSATWQTLIATVYDSWKFGQYPPVSSQYPSGFTATFPSQFYFAGSKPRDQAWDMLADVYEPDTGLYLGIKAYNQ